MIKIYNRDGEEQFFDTSNIYDLDKSTSLNNSLYSYFYIKALTANGFEVQFIAANNHLSGISLQFKIDNGSWQDYSLIEEDNFDEPQTIIVEEGQTVFFKGLSERISFSNEIGEYSYFNIIGSNRNTVEIGGDISSLVNFKKDVLSYDFYKLFYNCDQITSSKNLILPFETLSPHCYSNMFEKCSKMVDSPKMQAINLAEECCREMYKDCTSLVNPTELNSSVMATGCYLRMFSGCTSLQNFPILSSVVLAPSCYWGMFQGCTSLTTSPELPATTLASNCYNSMFNGCTSLATPPQLLATVMNYGCYMAMFQECTSLVLPPKLPATVLEKNCYYGMFQGCTSLTEAPELPATTLAIGCYKYMFWGCTSLAYSVELPSKQLVSGCYYGMFMDCSSLRVVKAYFDIPNRMYLRRWLDGASSEGVFIGTKNSIKQDRDILQLPEGWDLLEKEEDESIFKYKYLTFVILTEGVVSFTGQAGTVSFSLDEGETWSSFESSISQAVSVGERILWRGETDFSSSSFSSFGKFSCTAQFDIEGNIMSLLSKEDFWKEIDFEKIDNRSDIFSSLFSSTSVVSAEKMVLPALFLTDSCYKEMFKSCVNLLKAPKILPAMFLQEYCYQMMFKGCQILKTAPKLPAVDVKVGCYEEMFNQCYCLEEAPELPAKELKNICYRQMFSSCSNLKSIKADFLTAPVPFSHDDETDETVGGYTENWVNGVAPTGTFIYNDNFVGVKRGTDCVPASWLMLKESEEKFITEDYKKVWRTYGGFSAHPVPTNSYFENQPHYYQIGKITPCDTTKGGKIKYHVFSFSQSDNSYLLDSIIEVSFGKNGEFKEYSVQNTLQNNDRQPINYHVLYNDTEGGDIYIGVYHYNGTTSSQEGRVPNVIVKIDIVSCENCVISFGDLNILGFHAETNPLVSGIVNGTIKIINIPVFTGTHKSNYLIEAVSENISLLPNQVYNFGVISNATITLEGSNNPANTYQFFFTAESDQTSITLPSNVHFVNDFDWQIVANRKYQVYIINGMAVVNYI